MAVSSALRRLLHVREMEEEQQRLALESALGELHSIEHALAGFRAREHRGRLLLNESAGGLQVSDRTAAIVEVQSAGRAATTLTIRIVAAEGVVVRIRQAFFDKRLERRQAQTLIEEAEARDAIDAGRRTQQTLDESFGAQLYRRGRAAGKRPVPSGNGTGADLEPASARASHRQFLKNLEEAEAAKSTDVPKSGTSTKL
jgi:hypothetical protein